MTLRVRIALVLGVLVVAGLASATAVVLGPSVRAGKRVTIQRAMTVHALAFSPSGDLLLALESEELAEDDRRPSKATVTAWREPTALPAGVVVAEDDECSWNIAVSRGDIVAVQHIGGDVALFSFPKSESLGRVVNVRSGGNECFNIFGAVRFSPSGGLLAAGGADGTVSVWNVESRKLLNPPPGISDCWEFLGFVSEDRVAYVALDSSVCVWSLTTQSLAAKRPPVSSRMHVLSPRGTLCLGLATETSTPRSIPEWIRTVPGGRRYGEPVLLDRYDAAAFSNDDSLVAVAGSHHVYIQEVETGRPVFSSPLPEGWTASVVFSPTRDRLAVAHGKTIFVFPFRR